MYIPTVRSIFVPVEVKDVDIDAFVNAGIENAIREATALHPKAMPSLEVVGKRHYVVTLYVERRVG